LPASFLARGQEIEIEIQDQVVQSSFFNWCLTDDDLQVAHSNKEYHIAASASFL